MARNEKESPLLRLPGEIRNKIYEFAVGGHIIIIKNYGREPTYYDPSPPMRLSYCLFTPSSSLASKTATEAMKQPSPNGSTKMPKIGASERPSRIFGIDLVCRQIRAETAQIQYKHNIFEFDNCPTFVTFTMKLSAAQRNVITEISVDPVYIIDKLVGSKMGMGFSTRFAGPSYSFRAVLPKLKRFYIADTFLQLFHRDTEKEKIAFTWEILRFRKKRDDGLEMVLVDILDGAKKIKHAKRFTVCT